MPNPDLRRDVPRGDYSDAMRNYAPDAAAIAPQRDNNLTNLTGSLFGKLERLTATRQVLEGFVARIDGARMVPVPEKQQSHGQEAKNPAEPPYLVGSLTHVDREMNSELDRIGSLLDAIDSAIGQPR